MSAAALALVEPPDPVEEFLEWCGDCGYSNRTTHQYRSVLRRFQRAHPDPLQASTVEIREWLRQFSDLSVATRRAYTNVLVSFFKWAVDVEELLDRDPMRKVPRVRVPAGRPRPIPADRLSQAIVCADPRMRCWLLLGSLAGLRRSEIAAVRGEDIIDGRIHVLGKGAKYRIVPIHPTLAAALETWGVPNSGRLWYISPHRLGKLISRHLAECGIDATTHQLRHTFASRIYQTSGDLLKLQQLLGHASCATTQVYAAFSDDLDELVGRI